MKIKGQTGCEAAAQPTIGGLDRGTTFCRPANPKTLYIKLDDTDTDVQAALRGIRGRTTGYSAAVTLKQGRLVTYPNTEVVEPQDAEVSIK